MPNKPEYLEPLIEIIPLEDGDDPIIGLSKDELPIMSLFGGKEN